MILDLVRRHLRLEDRWQVRCATCGRVRDLDDLGGIRQALPLTRTTLAWCTRCHGLRLARVEPSPAPAEAERPPLD